MPAVAAAATYLARAPLSGNYQLLAISISLGAELACPHALFHPHCDPPKAGRQCARPAAPPAALSPFPPPPPTEWRMPVPADRYCTSPRDSVSLLPMLSAWLSWPSTT